MKVNKLLEKQLKKFFPEAYRDQEDFQLFINAVNDSYNAYERDKELSDHAFSMSEEEYRDINRQLKQEVEMKQASMNKLREAVAEIGESALVQDTDENELLNIASYLKQQISTRREAEKKLHDQKQFYEHVLNQIPADIAIIDPQHRYLFVNPSAVKDAAVRAWIIGKTEDEYRAYRNKPATGAIERKKHFYEVVNSRNQKEWEETVITPDGHTEYHLRVLHPVYNDRGEFEMMVIYGFNITERRTIEERIKQSEARYRSIFDNSLALICVHDLKGHILDMNNAAITTLGYSRDELSGTVLADLIPPDKRADFETMYMQEIRTKGKAEGIMVALSKEGRKTYLLYQNYLVANDNDQPYVIGFSQDITARMDAERALKKSEEKYRSIIENMNLGLIEVDLDDYIVYANQSFCDMSGYTPDELIGRKAPDVILQNEKFEAGEAILERRRDGKSDAYELKAKDKQGKDRWWLVSGAPAYDTNGNLKGTIGIHLDITRQKLLEQELRKAKADAEYSAHAKDIFLANMSHEIRTPMNAILGIGRMLAKTNLDTQQNFYLDTIRNASENLLVIINDLLDFSKIEAGKISLERIALDISDIVDNALQVLKYKAEEKGLALVAHSDPAIAPVLLGDPYRINQVLMNLLSNAIKFTEKGFITISCSLAEDTPAAQTVQFKVTDTGIGISEQFIQHLFDKFTQEDESITRKFGGTGLGMSISKQLIELMGGTIHVASQKNTGTTVSFTITFPKGVKAKKADAKPKADTSLLNGKHILLAEDNQINRLIATTLLKQYGAEVTEAENGNIAIEHLKHTTFDLVLMDVQMPIRDGLETTRYIRYNMESSIPIIALTASAFKQEEERCMQAGMNAFISKPFDEEKLITMVAQWLGGDTADKTKATAEQEYMASLYDLSKLRSMAGNDPAFIGNMITLLRGTLPENIQQMQLACDHMEWKKLAALAHYIKASLQSIDISSLADDIRYLESLRDTTDTIDITNVRTRLNHVQQVIDAVIKGLQQEPEYTAGQ